MWTFEAEGTIRSTPVLGSEQVSVGSWDSNVYGASKSTGDQQWAFETGGKVDSSTAIADGTVYVGSNDGTVYALAEQ